MGVVFAPARFSLVRTSIRDLVADGKSLVRNSGVGGGGGGSKFDPHRLSLILFFFLMWGVGLPKLSSLLLAIEDALNYSVLRAQGLQGKSPHCRSGGAMYKLLLPKQLHAESLRGKPDLRG